MKRKSATKPLKVASSATTERSRNVSERDAVRRRIIRAAAEIYREHGYERAGMNDIAQRLGTSDRKKTSSSAFSNTRSRISYSSCAA